MKRRRPKSNPWPDALPADVLMAMDFLEVHHPRMAMKIYDDIMARQKPLDADAFPHVDGLRREHLRKDATVIALAELSQSVYRHHAAPMDAVLAVSEPHLEEARGYREPDGIREFLHEVVMNDGDDETLSNEHGTMPTYERMGAFEPNDVKDWPLTFEELVLLTNNLFILRYSEMGGPPDYGMFPTKAEEQRVWEDLEEQYAEDDERGEDDEPTEPEDNDLITDDYVTFRRFGVNGPSGVVIRVRGADWREAVRAWMSREAFYPHVWHVSDHGNVRRLNVNNED